MLIKSRVQPKKNAVRQSRQKRPPNPLQRDPTLILQEKFVWSLTTTVGHWSDVLNYCALCDCISKLSQVPYQGLSLRP